MNGPDEAEKPSEDIEKRRWAIRRKFAIVAFIELAATPLWAPYMIRAEVPQEVVISLIWATVAIIGAYIGGVVIDDNWK